MNRTWFANRRKADVDGHIIDAHGNDDDAHYRVCSIVCEHARDSRFFSYSRRCLKTGLLLCSCAQFCSFDGKHLGVSNVILRTSDRFVRIATEQAAHHPKHALFNMDMRCRLSLTQTCLTLKRLRVTKY